MNEPAEAAPHSPLVAEIVPAPDPEACLHRAGSLPWTLWLESQVSDPATGRWSFLGLDPFGVLRARGRTVEWIHADGVERREERPLESLRRLLSAYRLQENAATPPFPGGAGGFLGYELGAVIEDVPTALYRDLDLPDMELGLYDLVIAWDRTSGRCWVTSTGHPAQGEAARERAARRLRLARAWVAGETEIAPALTAQVAAEGRKGNGLAPRPAVAEPRLPNLWVVEEANGLRSTFSRSGYEEAIRRCVAYIRDGDVYQANLSQRFQAALPRPSLLLRDRLAERNPAPFATLFVGSRCTLVGSSPERFLRLAPDGRVETRPIKGTRPRGGSRERDAALGRELEESVKDRAENLMISDLLRNDLSRVCRPGSVTVEALFRRETFASVHHLVSVIRGRLEEGHDAVSLFGACFPGGSVTGAPKIRAMEIIAELEPVFRGPYCGATGYFGFDGSMDTSIVIRSFVVVDGIAYFHAGGAVVADSDPGAEYLETLDKAASLVAAIQDLG